MPGRPTARERVRAEITREITEVARAHLAREGAAALSLRAVARDVGMVSSAVYRYFPSRDELLTALIIDAYDALGEAVEKRESQVDRADLAGRWLAVCHSVREWALEHPHEYALIYGSPVPGYRAPERTIPPASRVALVLGRLLVDAGSVSVPALGAPLTPQARAALEPVLSEPPFSGLSPDLMLAGLTVWSALFGAVSFELFGQFHNVLADPSAWFEVAVRRLGGLVGMT